MACPTDTSNMPTARQRAPRRKRVHCCARTYDSAPCEMNHLVVRDVLVKSLYARLLVLACIRPFMSSGRSDLRLPSFFALGVVGVFEACGRPCWPSCPPQLPCIRDHTASSHSLLCHHSLWWPCLARDACDITTTPWTEVGKTTSARWCVGVPAQTELAAKRFRFAYLVHVHTGTGDLLRLVSFFRRSRSDAAQVARHVCMLFPCPGFKGRCGAWRSAQVGLHVPFAWKDTPRREGGVPTDTIEHLPWGGEVGRLYRVVGGGVWLAVPKPPRDLQGCVHCR
ncbi:hypothetical protein B0H63DRAFT_161715 [Podospora didyma]|uniref:Uncharacterized protein n=1 Tax=Podospora didyma TaxID=330526 RepID=A0AAE0NTX9_9PEZI|nr:hypothetical protein B0H63DRAFT_161715 [Podospora didyma]